MVIHDEFTFHLRCKCGYEMEGFFGSEDVDETLHCECGLEWVVKRPKAIDRDRMTQ